jgi:hypothetical protein
MTRVVTNKGELDLSEGGYKNWVLQAQFTKKTPKSPEKGAEALTMEKPRMPQSRAKPVIFYFNTKGITRTNLFVLSSQSLT